MIYDYTLKANDGSDFALSDYKGKVLLFVNTATRCGFTPQYKELEAIYEKYQSQGLEIIDIPCNQFMEQATEDDQGLLAEVQNQIPQDEESRCQWENELPLYTYLKAQQKFKGFGNRLKATAMSLLLRKPNNSSIP